MLTVEGIFNNGNIQLLEPIEATEPKKVLVTFIENTDIDLTSLGISKAEAAELRAKFETFEDWNDPAMDVYNDYDNALKALRQ